MNEKWTAAFRERLDGLGVQYDAVAPERLARYHALLTDWNTRMNLTGDTEFSLALDRLYCDSLAPLAIDGLFPADASLIDVGTGAGFPGLPLAIARPDLRVTLMDSLAKRLTFLQTVIDDLGLVNVRVCHARAEDGGQAQEHRERYDIAVARGVAPLPVLLEYLLPFVRVDGRTLCYKGPAAQDEWEAGSRAAKTLGGGSLTRWPVTIPAQPEWAHCVLAVPKAKKTLRQYPRKAGTPARSPLGGIDG